MNLISRKSKWPLYQQVYESLRRDIVAGQWKPGDLLPTEAELVARFRVSTITVRQALEMLHGEGLIYRQRGRGTFVAHPSLEQNLVRIVSFTQDMERRGFKPGSRVLAAELIPAPAEIAEKLDVPPGEELARLERLRLADDEPLSLETSYLVHRACRGVLERHDYASFSLREALERDFGLRIARARQSIRAVAAPAALARTLSLAARAPVLLIERVAFTQDDTPLEFLRILYRGDRYTLHNELQG